MPIKRNHPLLWHIYFSEKLPQPELRVKGRSSVTCHGRGWTGNHRTTRMPKTFACAVCQNIFACFMPCRSGGISAFVVPSCFRRIFVTVNRIERRKCLVMGFRGEFASWSDSLSHFEVIRERSGGRADLLDEWVCDVHFGCEWKVVEKKKFGTFFRRITQIGWSELSGVLSLQVLLKFKLFFYCYYASF